MRGRIILEAWITREAAQARPDMLFVFGDNMVKAGFGGQAAALRGEPNAVGIPTKWRPSKAEDAYFTDSDRHAEAIIERVNQAFARLDSHLAAGGDVVVPARGVGGGLANIGQRAPIFARWLDRRFEELNGGPIAWPGFSPGRSPWR